MGNDENALRNHLVLHAVALEFYLTAHGDLVNILRLT